MLSKRVSLRADCINAGRRQRVSFSNEQRQQRVRQVFDVTENDDGRLPAQRDTSRRNMHEHQYNVNSQHNVETTFRERQVSAAVKNVSGEGADGEFCSEESQVAVFEDAGHEGIAFGSDTESNPQQRQLSIKPIETEK